MRDKIWEEGGRLVCREAERRLGGSRWWPVGLMRFSGFFFFFCKRRGAAAGLENMKERDF